MYWLKKIKNWFFYFFLKKEKSVTSDKTEFFSKTSADSGMSEAIPLEVQTNDLVKELQTLKEEISEKLNIFKEVIKNIELLEKNAERAVKKSENAQNFVVYGFIALIFVVAGLVFSYIEFVYSGSKNDDYKYNLSEKINNNLNEIKNLKLCLDSNKWLNPKCFEN